MVRRFNFGPLGPQPSTGAARWVLVTPRRMRTFSAFHVGRLFETTLASGSLLLAWD